MKVDDFRVPHDCGNLCIYIYIYIHLFIYSFIYQAIDIVSPVLTIMVYIMILPDDPSCHGDPFLGDPQPSVFRGRVAALHALPAPGDVPVAFSEDGFGSKFWHQ